MAAQKARQSRASLRSLSSQIKGPPERLAGQAQHQTETPLLDTRNDHLSVCTPQYFFAPLEETLGQGTQFNICDLNGLWVCLLDCGTRHCYPVARDVSDLARRARRCAEAIVNRQSQFLDNENTVSWPDRWWRMQQICGLSQKSSAR
jgi:hypothetical protein